MYHSPHPPKVKQKKSFFSSQMMLFCISVKASYFFFLLLVRTNQKVLFGAAPVQVPPPGRVHGHLFRVPLWVVRLDDLHDFLEDQLFKEEKEYQDQFIWEPDVRVCVFNSYTCHLRRCLQNQGARHHEHAPPESSSHSRSAPSSFPKCPQHAPGAASILHACRGTLAQSPGTAPRTAGSSLHCGPWVDLAPADARPTWAHPDDPGRS